MDETLGLIRHVLTYAGGTLVTNGFLSASDMQLVVGAVITLMGIGWSVYEKRRRG